MKDLLINKSFNFISNHKELSEYNEIKIKYGLEVMYNFIFKTMAVLLLALLFNVLIEVLLIFIFYGFLRSFVHGVHGNSNIICWILTLVTYIISIFIIKNYAFSFNISVIICIFSFISFLFWAPSDTKYRPLLSVEKRKKLKLLSLLISIIYSIIILFTPFKYTNCLLISLCLSSIVINPISYKLFGLKRNNYKSYI